MNKPLISSEIALKLVDLRLDGYIHVFHGLSTDRENKCWALTDTHSVSNPVVLVRKDRMGNFYLICCREHSYIFRNVGWIEYV